MKVTLIYPGFKGDASGLSEPLGILYIASVLRDKGHKVSFIDMTFNKNKNIIERLFSHQGKTNLEMSETRSVSDHVKNAFGVLNGRRKSSDKTAKNSDLIGMSCTSLLVERASKLIKQIKKIDPFIPCFLGGSHGTNDPENALKAGFDYVIIGEGEITIEKLVSTLEKNKSISSIEGLAFKKQNKITINPKSSYVKNLDKIPFPARDLWDYNQYFKTGTTDN